MDGTRHDGWRLGYRPGLDQLRGVAVLIVLIAHGLIDTPFHKAGAVGVTLFFVLSGFLITRLLIEERWASDSIDLRRFYVRRARRLLPALPLAFAVCAGVNVLIGGYPVTRPVVAASTYSINFATTTESFGAFNHFWSLAVEEHFYLLWPGLVALVPMRAVPWLAGIGVVGSALGRIFLASGGNDAYQWTQYRTDAILLGALLAFVVTQTPKVTRPMLWGSILVLVVFLPDATAPIFLTWGATAVAAASVMLVRHCTGIIERRAWLEHLGRISYGVYLFHFPIMRGMEEAARASVWLTLPATVLGSIVWAEMSYRLIERRALRPRSRPVPAAVMPVVAPT